MPELFVEPLTNRWVCFKCNKDSTGKKKLFKCAGCHAITYCGQECQVADRPRHAFNCVPVMVTEIPRKGRGLVAARDIKMGERIFKEKMAIKLPLKMTESSVISNVKSLKDQLETLPMEARALFFKLSPSYSQKFSHKWKTVKQYLVSNGTSERDILAFRLFMDNSSSRESYSRVYLNMGLVNHSCAPNSCKGELNLNEELKCDDVDEEFELRAIRNICKGEEITFCYVSNFKEFGFNSRKRAAVLKKAVGFDCKCPVCLGKVPGQDKLMKKLIELHKITDPDPSDWRREAGIRDQIVDLFDELNIGHPGDKFDALLDCLLAASLACDKNLVTKVINKCRQMAEETNLVALNRRYERMEREFAPRTMESESNKRKEEVD